MFPAKLTPPFFALFPTFNDKNVAALQISEV
jgi:hypothetical protein